MFYNLLDDLINYSYGMCLLNYDIFNEDFVLFFFKIYVVLYFFMFIFVVVLYFLIYWEIYVRWVRKVKRKWFSLYLSQSCVFEVLLGDIYMILMFGLMLDGNVDELIKNGYFLK